ncbi:enoyl-CoA hydratase/carnithine racemase [Branchiibius hedensis]|uniref:Enoyl-CoA hydratase/carnithine racemase n=1 Tax=Branchiibius hedensis TaxID=672460 RepID=A0A2Y8ZRT0_9MICO|nr:enoyl-CoA hydratase/isomerase family protein [Branchiibius hedensis]PWJ26278.1 enoyl-CoA hydratase/carnithine racemase [Branchiibius hedensis]SSA35090.1 Enoyl-CoA hydratase/carnithine racemase [Branchiibius hedensis]
MTTNHPLDLLSFRALRVAVHDGVATVTIDNPPLNILDTALITDLRRFVDTVRNDGSVLVVVFESADPEFFSAHGDAEFVSKPQLFTALIRSADAPLNPMEALHESVRTLPQITIGKLAGYARGGGLELLMSMDMRFAALDTAKMAHPEAALGIVPGGGGTQFLPRLTGRARALEIILGGGLIDASTAERYGLVNRALPDAQLDDFVDSLARRIAAVGAEVIAGAVRCVDAALSTDLSVGLEIENHELGRLFTADSAQHTIDLIARGYQTREVEKDLEGFLHPSG